MRNKRGTIDRRKQVKRIAKQEGGRLSLSIAQIDEVVRLMYLDLERLYKQDPELVVHSILESSDIANRIARYGD